MPYQDPTQLPQETGAVPPSTPVPPEQTPVNVLEEILLELNELKMFIADLLH